MGSRYYALATTRMVNVYIKLEVQSFTLSKYDTNAPKKLKKGHSTVTTPPWVIYRPKVNIYNDEPMYKI